MIKLKETVLMLCLVLSGAFCCANGVARTENVKGKETPRIIIMKAHHGGIDKSGSIVATLYDHILSVAFTENLGQVDIEVATASGTSVQFTSTQTPNGVQCYIPNTGDYIITFTLPNGDEYYGEFTVTD